MEHILQKENTSRSPMHSFNYLSDLDPMQLGRKYPFEYVFVVDDRGDLQNRG
jgi:hypothetical protein